MAKNEHMGLSLDSHLQSIKTSTHFRWWFAVALWLLLLISYIDRTNISIAAPFMVSHGVVTAAALGHLEIVCF